MGRVNTPILTASQRQELERGLREGNASTWLSNQSHCFRMRCQSVLLKSKGAKSKDVGLITGMCAVSVNSWVSRYIHEGLSGLSTKPGGGRKHILSETEYKASILSAIKSNRQRMRTAKAEWEASSGKKVCDTTFKAFLKTLAENINV
jgi:transposase